MSDDEVPGRGMNSDDAAAGGHERERPLDDDFADGSITWDADAQPDANETAAGHAADDQQPWQPPQPSAAMPKWMLEPPITPTPGPAIPADGRPSAALPAWSADELAAMGHDPVADPESHDHSTDTADAVIPVEPMNDATAAAESLAASAPLPAASGRGGHGDAPDSAATATATATAAAGAFGAAGADTPDGDADSSGSDSSGSGSSGSAGHDTFGGEAFRDDAFDDEHGAFVDDPTATAVLPPMAAAAAAAAAAAGAGGEPPARQHGSGRDGGGRRRGLIVLALLLLIGGGIFGLSRLLADDGDEAAPGGVVDPGSSTPESTPAPDVTPAPDATPGPDQTPAPAETPAPQSTAGDGGATPTVPSPVPTAAPGSDDQTAGDPGSDDPAGSGPDAGTVATTAPDAGPDTTAPATTDPDADVTATTTPEVDQTPDAGGPPAAIGPPDGAPPRPMVIPAAGSTLPPTDAVVPTYDLSSEASCQMLGSAREGQSGSDVLCLKERLAEVTVGDVDFEVDAIFDTELTAAVITFQEVHGLIVDGIVGGETARALGIWNS